MLTNRQSARLKGDCQLTFQDPLAGKRRPDFYRCSPAAAPNGGSAEADRLSTTRPRPAAVIFAATFAYRGDEQRRLGELAELAATARTPLLATADALYHHPNRRVYWPTCSPASARNAIDDGKRAIAWPMQSGT